MTSHLYKNRAFKYHAFASYSREPDYHLVRKTESFLEGLRQVRTHLGSSIPQIDICVDGSDFKRPRPTKKNLRESNDHDPVWEAILAELSQSARLMVFCSRKAVSSHYVNKEIDWFLEHRDKEDVILVVTEGEDPKQFPEEIFPKAIRDENLHDNLWYDFRGSDRKRQKKHLATRDFDDARLNLAAALLDLSTSELSPLWWREQHRRNTQKLTFMTVVAISMIVLSVFATTQWSRAKQNQEKAAAHLQLAAQGICLLGESIVSYVKSNPKQNEVREDLLPPLYKASVAVGFAIDHGGDSNRHLDQKTMECLKLIVSQIDDLKPPVIQPEHTKFRIEAERIISELE
jgi:hypothetical protein